MSERGERGFLTVLGVLVLLGYGYAFIFEKPGSVSLTGIIALAMANVCLLVILSYVALRWYRRRSAK